VNFIPSYAHSTDGFSQMLDAFLQVGNSTTRQAQKTCITTRYQNAGGGDPKKMAKAVIQDSMFVCNARFLYNAATNSGTTTPIWLMWYAFFANFKVPLKGTFDFAVHASDLLPTFWNSEFDPSSFSNMICDLALPNWPKVCRDAVDLFFIALKAMRPTYQKYFASFILNSDPNPKSSGAPPWPHPVNTNGVLSQVQKITGKGQYAAPQTDPFLDDAACGFWACMADAVVNNEIPQCNCQPMTEMDFVVQESDGKDEL